MSTLKIGIKCLPCYGTHNSSPLTIRFPSQMSRSHYFIVYMLICLFWNFEYLHVTLIPYQIRKRNMKLCGNTHKLSSFLYGYKRLSPRLQSSVWLKENSFLSRLCTFHWSFLWTLELIWSRTVRNTSCKTWDPTQPCYLPVLLHDSTPHSLHLTWDTPVWGPSSSAMPQLNMSDVNSSNTNIDKHCALLSLEQLMGEDKGDVTWFPSSSLLGELSTEAGKRNRM